MKEEIAKTIDTAQENRTQVSEPEIKSTHGAFSKVKRELTDADLKNPVVGRLLLSQNDKCEQEIAVLKEYKEKYYDADKRAEVLEERIKSLEHTTNGRSIFLTTGGLLGGFLPSLWATPKFFWPAAVVAVILFLMAILKPIQRS